MPEEPTDTPSTLDRTRVVAEALRLVDEEGFGRLTMRNLAARLGVAPMATYRHVTNKEELVDAVFDLATSEIERPDPTLEWRQGLHALTHAIRNLLLAHPAIAVEIVGRPSLGPAALEVAEYGYGVMRSSGFADEDCLAGVNTLVTYAIGFTALEVSRRHAVGDAPPPDLSRLQAAYTDLPADRFPHTVELQPEVEGLVTVEQFEFGLDIVLDGFEQRLRATTETPCT